MIGLTFAQVRLLVQSEIDTDVIYYVQHEKPSFLSTKPTLSTQLAGVACKTLRRSKNSVFEVDLSIIRGYQVGSRCPTLHPNQFVIQLEPWA